MNEIFALQSALYYPFSKLELVTNTLRSNFIRIIVKVTYPTLQFWLPHQRAHSFRFDLGFGKPIQLKTKSITCLSLETQVLKRSASAQITPSPMNPSFVIWILSLPYLVRFTITLFLIEIIHLNIKISILFCKKHINFVKSLFLYSFSRTEQYVLSN